VGDLRFTEPYHRLRDGENPRAVLHALTDEEVVAALAAAASEGDSLLANVLATEGQNRITQYGAILATMAEGVLAVSPMGGISSMNPAAERVLGWTLEEARGEDVDDLLRTTIPGPGGARLPWRLSEHVLWSGELSQCEDARFVQREGGTVHVAFSAAPILREGDVRGAVVVFRDITEARRNQEALRQSEAGYRLLLDSVTDHAIFRLDPQGHVSSWNPAAERMKGWREEEILGWHYSVLFTPEEVAEGKPWRELEVAAREGRFSEEAPRIRKDGTLFEASVTLSAVRDEAGELLGFVKVTRDVTERKAWEKRLRADEQRYRTLFDLSPDPLAWCDPSGIIVDVNGALLERLGYATAELLGKPYLDVVAPESRQPFASAVAEVLRSGVGVTLPVTLRAREGHTLDLGCRLMPTRLDEESLGFFALCGPRASGQAP